VVISDIMMPVMDGVELIRQVHKQYPMTGVIMITGYVTMENVLSCMRHGADTCVYKPFTDMKELEDAVSHAVGRLTHWQEKLKSLLKMKQ
jgi:YesN/AraC family two-component response regulator